MKKYALFLTIILSMSISARGQQTNIQSPFKVLSAKVNIGNGNNSISLSTTKEKVVDIKLLDFELEKYIIEGNWEITSEKNNSVVSKWKPVYGDKKEIQDNYNELSLILTSSINKKEINLLIRLYDEGIALKYNFDPLDFWNCTIKAENTCFSFPTNAGAWVSSNAQGIYTKTTLDKISGEVERPLVVNPNPELFVALGEATLVNYARMKFKNSSTSDSYIIQSALSGAVELCKAEYATPWRYAMVGKSAGELLENSHFIMNLNEPCQIKDTSWIKPGKILREVTLTTEGSLAAVDFAARNNIEYVEFDAGWYGAEESLESDASEVNVDPARSTGPLDLQHIIEYADKKGVGILVYVNKKALENQLDKILPLYQKWGIKGVKYGFVNVGSQHDTAWLHHAVRKAAKYKLMVDIHDEYRPTGYSRTYPNLMTQEGIRGDEESPTSEQALTTMFTRAIAGAGDLTNCFYDSRVYNKMGGKAAQMAKAVMIYSPWQFIYWYDRPADAPRKAGGAGGNKESIINEKDNTIEFYQKLPVVWDETKVLQSSIGEYAAIARKSGNRWYIGMLGANEKRNIKINLDFIDSIENATAKLYSQSHKDMKNNEVTISKMNLKNNQFDISLEKDAGAVLILEF